MTAIHQKSSEEPPLSLADKLTYGATAIAPFAAAITGMFTLIFAGSSPVGIAVGATLVGSGVIFPVSMGTTYGTITLFRKSLEGMSKIGKVAYEKLSIAPKNPVIHDRM
jgi:hypothetical protein